MMCTTNNKPSSFSSFCSCSSSCSSYPCNCYCYSSPSPSPSSYYYCRVLIHVSVFVTSQGKKISSQWKLKLLKNQDCKLGGVCKSWQSRLLIMVNHVSQFAIFSCFMKIQFIPQHQKIVNAVCLNQCLRHPEVINLNLPERTLTDSEKDQSMPGIASNRRMWASCSAQQARRLDSRISRCLWETAGTEIALTCDSETPISNLSILLGESGATPWLADISTKPLPFGAPARIGVPGPPRCPWETAWAEIAAPCESAKPISNVSILLLSAGATHSRISRQSLCLLGRGMVGWNRADALQRRPEPKSLRRASLRFRMSAYSSCHQARPHDSRISWQNLTLFERGSVRWDSADALERWPEPKSIRSASRARLRSWFRRRASCSCCRRDPMIGGYLDKASAF